MLIVPRTRLYGYVYFGEAAEIDRSRAHAQGLVLYVHVGRGNQVRDLVSGVTLDFANGANIVSTARGPMLDCVGANRGAQASASPVNFTFPSNAGSILWAGYCPDQSQITSTARIAGMSYDNGVTAPYDVMTIVADNFFGNLYPTLVWNDGAGTNRSIGNTTERFDADGYCQAVGTIKSGAQQLWVRGNSVGTQASAHTSFGVGTSPQIIFGTYPGLTRNSGQYSQTLAFWCRELTQAEIQDLYVYGPGLMLRRNTTAWSIPKGIAAVSATGNPTGVAASPELGSLIVATSASVTGVAMAPALGTLITTGPASATLAGVSALAAVGSLGNAFVAITGVQGAALAQAPAVGLQSISGVAAGAGVGALTAGGGTSAAPTIAGVLAYPGLGTLTVSFASIPGVSAAAAVGSLAFAIDGTAAITGVTAFSATGQPVGQVTVSYASITGVSCVAAPGSLSVTATAAAAIAGLSAVAAVGSLLGVNTRFALFINGVDRTRMLQADSLQGNRDLTGQTSCNFTLYDRRGQWSNRPPLHLLTAPQAVEPVAEVYIPPEQRKGVLDLGPNDCRWPIGDPQVFRTFGDTDTIKDDWESTGWFNDRPVDADLEPITTTTSGDVGPYPSICAIDSVKRAQAATADGSFQWEIAPVTVSGKGGDVVIDKDEGPLKARLDKIAALRPAFKKDGTITAASSSSINDGAAALVLMRESTAKKLGVKPIAKILAHARHSQAPNLFTTAPVGSIEKLYAKTGWSTKEVDLFEVNEAFAAVAMAAMRDHGISHDKINIHGGACALGHPIGASGARILVTLLGALKKTGGKRGVASLCIGGGEATALALEMA